MPSRHFRGDSVYATRSEVRDDKILRAKHEGGTVAEHPVICRHRIRAAHPDLFRSKVTISGSAGALEPRQNPGKV